MDAGALQATKRIKKMVNTDNLKQDMISELPDDLIVYILSLLPTEDAIPTGALSKRWKNMWKKVQNLRFTIEEDHDGFTDHVTDALISYQNPSFSSLTISVSNYYDPMDLILWFRIAFAKKVEKLVLRLNKFTEQVMFPDCVLRRKNGLRILKLMGNINLNLIFVSVFLDCLKELHLYNVRFENAGSVTRLLDGCPILQDLILDIHISSGVSILMIHAPSLQRLTLATYNCEGEHFVIQTPRLRYMNIKNFDGVDTCLIENAPAIAEATIFRHHENIDENILTAIRSSHRLSRSAPLKTPRNTHFHNLKSLEIDTQPDEWCNLLSYMLSCSPGLQILNLIGGRFTRWATTWAEPQPVAECLLDHLHTIQWEDYVWEGEDDIEVATYLLKHARQLKNATFTTLEPDTHSEVQQRQTILDQLSDTDRPSHSCNLVFKNSHTKAGHVNGKHDPDLGEFTY